MYTNIQKLGIVRGSTIDSLTLDAAWQRILNRTVAIGLIGLVFVLGEVPQMAFHNRLFVLTLFLLCCLLLFWKLTTDSRGQAQAQHSPINPNFLLWGRIILIWGIMLAIFLLLIKFTKSNIDIDWNLDKSISLNTSPKLLISWAIIVPLAAYIMHPTLVFTLSSLQSARQISKKTVIAGANPLSEHLAYQLKSLGNLQMQFLGFFDDEDEQSRVDNTFSSKSMLGSLEHLPTFVKENQVQVVYIALPSRCETKIQVLLEQLQDTTACVYLVPNLPSLDLRQTRTYSINGIPVLALWEIPFSGFQSALKRMLDVCLAGLALLVLFPIMLLIALGVRLTSPGPALFKQLRHGFNGEKFWIYKFRSMRVMENGNKVIQAQRNDSRVTPFGAFLRRTSLDELPQIINVLQGRMSIVGPRPHAIAHNRHYRELISGYMLRHKVKPGITGWAQVNGLRGETDALEKMRERVDYDLYYLKNWSLGLDLLIILRTALICFKTKDVY
jgi:putative colanic acid biosysnthesis UDP-glucose lipid carrier transferase